MNFQEFWSEHGTTAIIAVVIVVFGGMAWKLLAPKKKIFVEEMTLNVRCRGCSWQPGEC